MTDIQLQIRRLKRSNETKLDLSSKAITFLPSDIYGLDKLEVLELQNNKLTSLDPKISTMSSLKILDLSGNQIMNIPSQILELKNLQVLNLSNNPLIKQFEPLLNQENQTAPRLQQTLQVCFGLAEDNLQESPLSSGLDKLQNQTQLMSNIVEKDNVIKIQKLKIDDLSQRLEKLELSNKKQGSSSFGVSPSTETVMEIEFSDLEIGESISQGGFSTVHKGEFRCSPVAIKKIFNPNITQELLEEINNEVNMLARLRHPNIVLLMGIVSKPPQLCIVTEFLPHGDLFTLLHKNKNTQLSNQVKLQIAKQIASIFVYLHKCQVVHRDLKSYNILIDDNYKVKLCDFGLARKFSELNSGSQKFSGTPTYMALEMYQKKSYDHKVDVFAYGTLLWELYAREVPFDGQDPQDIMIKIQQDDSLPAKNGIPSQIMDIINSSRKVNPNQRSNFDEIYKKLSQI